jgi:hypothetical protein
VSTRMFYLMAIKTIRPGVLVLAKMIASPGRVRPR